MKEYTISVDGKYFVGATMEPIKGQAIAPNGFSRWLATTRQLHMRIPAVSRMPAK